MLKDENFDVLQKIADVIISKFLKEGVTTERELSHIKFDKEKQIWTPSEFHLTMIRAMRKPLNATQLIEEFGNASLGKVQLKDIHISSREDFETPDGDRKTRKFFNNIRNSEATFACESKIMLT